MYAGHVGIALGAKGLKKALPLWFVIVASQLPDWADATLCLANVRTPVPGMYSHSLPALAVLVLIAAGAYFAFERDVAGCLIIAAVVASHVATDYLTGIKPTWGSRPLIGLGLYGRPAIDFVIETIVITGGWLLYRRTLPADRRSSGPVVQMITILIAAQLAADVFMHFAKGLRKC